MTHSWRVAVEWPESTEKSHDLGSWAIVILPYIPLGIGGWPSCSVLPSSPCSNHTEGLQGLARAGTFLATAACVLHLSLPDNKHLDPPRGTETTLQGSQMLFMHTLEYILFRCASLPALFREVVTVSGFSSVLCTRKFSSAPLKKTSHLCQDVLGEL